MQTPEQFWASHWEQRPGVFKAGGKLKRAAALKGALTWERFCELLDEREEAGECLLFNVDAHAMRYVDGQRLDLAPQEDIGAEIERSTAEEIFAHGGTFQARCTPANGLLARACATSFICSSLYTPSARANSGSTAVSRTTFRAAPASRGRAAAAAAALQTCVRPRRCTSRSASATLRTSSARRSRRSLAAWWAATHTSPPRARRALPLTTTTLSSSSARPKVRTCASRARPSLLWSDMYVARGARGAGTRAGRKRWKVYSPPEGAELPCVSSDDIDRSALPVQPLLEATLQPGDVLYLPRGYIHEAEACEGGPSTHLTVSSYQDWSRFDLLAQCMQAQREVCAPALRASYCRRCCCC